MLHDDERAARREPQRHRRARSRTCTCARRCPTRSSIAPTQIELVDIAPEELLAAPAEKAKCTCPSRRRARRRRTSSSAATCSRCASSPCAAPREHVDEDVQEYREEHRRRLGRGRRASASWCASGPAPSSARLIRAAARMAAGLRAPWVAAYVELALGDDERRRSRAARDAHLRLAESLGGDGRRASPARASPTRARLRAQAQRHRASSSASRRTLRLRDRMRGSLLDEIVRGSGRHRRARHQRPTRPVTRRYAVARAAPNRRDQRALRRGRSRSWRSTARSGSIAPSGDEPCPTSRCCYLLAVMMAAFRFGARPDRCSPRRSRSLLRLLLRAAVPYVSRSKTRATSSPSR